MTTEHTLDSLLDSYAFAVRSYALAPDADAAARIDVARAALLAHVATHYVRRERLVPDEWDDLDATAPVKTGYTAARGILSLPACPQCGSRAVLVEEQHATLAYYPEYSDDAGSVHRGDSNARGARYLCRRCDHRFEGER